MNTGTIEFTGKDIGVPAMPMDKLAINGRSEILLVSVIADAMQIKAMRAIMCGGAKAIAQAGGCKVQRQGEDSWYAHAPGRMNPTAEGYAVYLHKFGFNLVHAMFITRAPGFMRIVSEEALWQKLKSTEFTTPILREWVPYIDRELRRRNFLEDCHTFGQVTSRNAEGKIEISTLRCALLSAGTGTLDIIVSEGLARYDLVIPRPAIPL